MRNWVFFVFLFFWFCVFTVEAASTTVKKLSPHFASLQLVVKLLLGQAFFLSFVLSFFLSFWVLSFSLTCNRQVLKLGYLELKARLWLLPINLCRDCLRSESENYCLFSLPLQLKVMSNFWVFFFLNFSDFLNKIFNLIKSGALFLFLSLLVGLQLKFHLDCQFLLFFHFFLIPISLFLLISNFPFNSISSGKSTISHLGFFFLHLGFPYFSLFNQIFSCFDQFFRSQILTQGLFS